MSWTAWETCSSVHFKLFPWRQRGNNLNWYTSFLELCREMDANVYLLCAQTQGCSIKKKKATASETLKGDDTRTFPLHTLNLESFLMRLASNHCGRIGSIESYQGQKSRWCWFQPAKISFVGFGSLVYSCWSMRIYGELDKSQSHTPFITGGDSSFSC